MVRDQAVRNRYRAPCQRCGVTVVPLRDKDIVHDDALVTDRHIYQ